jgi:hypothetical protein
MLSIPLVIQNNASTRASALLRDIAPRQDRVPVDDRVDLPEIQESFRVSFSDQTRVQHAGNRPEHQPTRQQGLGPTGIEAYLRVAGF